jgi:hypothetical protein
MSTETEVVEDLPVVPHGRALRWRRDRIFFAVMAAAAALTVFAGFSRTYFLKGFFETRALSLFFHVHGAVFTCWIILFVVQVALVAAGRTDIHRRLGIAGAILAALMVVIGLMAAIDSARRGFTPPNGPSPLVFLVIPVADVIVFATLIGAGLWLRRSSAAHKRLMLLGTLSILTPAIARLPGIAAAGPLAFLGLTDVFIVACLVYDRLGNGRIHRAFLWGGLFIIISQPLRLLIGQTPMWLAFARWLIR